MPRDSQGAYSLPNGTLVSAGDTIQVSQHNPAMSDIAAALSQSLSRTGQGAMQSDLNMGGYSLNNLNNLTVGGTLTVNGSAFNPASYAVLASSPIFTGGSVVSQGSVTPEFRYRWTGGNQSWRSIATVGQSNKDLVFQYSTDNFASNFTDALRIRTDGGAQVSGLLLINQGRAAVGSERYNTGGYCTIKDGTGAPTGGAEGDLYFQYTP